MVDLISPIIQIVELVGRHIVKVKELYKGFDSELDRLQSLIKQLEPPMEELRRICGDAGVDSSKTDKLTDWGKKQIAELHQLLDECNKLLEECINSKKSKTLKIIKYSERLQKSRENLESFISINVKHDAFVASIIRNFNADLSFAAPLPPDLTVGFKESLEELRRKLLESPQKVFGICGMGGSGKTTLAAMVCNDDRVTAEYGKSIFLAISSSPDLGTVCQQLLEYFHVRVAKEAAINGLATFLRGREDKKLVVLDDWCLDEDIGKLVDAFKGAANFKVLLISRTELRDKRVPSYPLYGLLSEDDARQLFEHHANLNLPRDKGSWTPNEKLIDKVVRGCKRHPLTLKVIGGSLANRDERLWEDAAHTLDAPGEIFQDSGEEDYRKIIQCLSTSLRSLGERERECFLDLGSFPEDQRIPATPIIDMWTETRNMDENRAYKILDKLGRRSLVKLFDRTGGEAGDADGSFGSLSASQHDLLRQLAIHEGKKEGTGQITRLIMARRDGNIPKIWIQEKDRTRQAKLVSINTGDMKSWDWPDLDLPNAEVLIINFSATSYCLPNFLQGMKNLKVLVVANHGSNRAELDGLSLLSSLNKLKRVMFRKISLPAEPLRSVETGGFQLRSRGRKFVNRIIPLIAYASTEPPQELHKLSLVLCDVRHMLHIPSLFPRVRDLEIDYCTDLQALPDTICDISNMEKLSITNSPDLLNLPDGIGKLQELKVLRLRACGNLKRLPQSLSQLSELRFLDISYCSSLDAFPEGMENLSCLGKIDMRSCLNMKQLPPSVMRMQHLNKVDCYEEAASMWTSCGLDPRKLCVRREEVNLNFLQA